MPLHPAMNAAITDHIWLVRELLSTALFRSVL